MLPRIRLKQILFFTFTLIASLPVLILAAWVQQSALDKEISSVEEKHLLVARNLTGDLERYVIDVESSLELVAKNLNNDKEIEGLPEHLASLFIRHIWLVDSDGNILKRVTAKAQPPINRFKPEIFQLLLPIMQESRNNPGKVLYSDLQRTGEDETTFFLVKKLQNERFVIGALSTMHIIQAQKKVSFGRRGHAAIVDRTGRAIAHPVPGWIKSMKDMSFLPPVKKMMMGETGVSKFFTPAMQADMVAGYTVVPRAGWGVMVPQPFEELEERANDVHHIALTIALFGIAIAGLISWYIAGFLSGPIQSVVDATELGSEENRSPFAAEVVTSRRFVPDELRVLLSSFNLMRNKINNLTMQLHSKIDLANAEVKNQNELLQKQSVELQETNKKLEKLTCTDSLTTIFNRRHFDNALEKELAYANRQKEAFGLMMIDLDNFKGINDKYGHAAGDSVLFEIAKLILSNVRKSDIACRVGGEEFAIICRRTSSSEIRTIAEILRNKVEQHIITHNDTLIKLTASIGMVTYPADSASLYSQDDLYRLSDLAMYHSKKHGRNRVTHYSDIESDIESAIESDIASDIGKEQSQVS